MQAPLNATSSNAGTLLSNSVFEVPPFQREYSWGQDEVSDFWNDLSSSLDSETYFLGLVILTDGKVRKHVVDGQQRLVTLTLLANALYYEAIQRGRKALADRIKADFLYSIDYDSDETVPRIKMSDVADDSTLQTILSTGMSPSNVKTGAVSDLLIAGFDLIRKKLLEDLKDDPFKRLGKWAEFLTNKVYFAVFTHPNSAKAYQVYEVINTRGKELTTADLLKNYIISQVSERQKDNYYKRWKAISKQFATVGDGHFVQFIRHVVTVDNGHVLPKDLFEFLASRSPASNKEPPTPNQLMNKLEDHLPLYMQMVDPTLGGPADDLTLKIFSALDSLNVIAVRPILMALSELPKGLDGMHYVLRLVVRRIVVGNLGTGNVERKFGETAKRISETRSLSPLKQELESLNPSIEDFVEQLKKRSFNKGILAFVRRSILQEKIAPDITGALHFIWTKQSSDWRDISEEDGAYWGSTIGNTFLSDKPRRDKQVIDWNAFKKFMLPDAIKHEWRSELNSIKTWNADAVEEMGSDLAQAAGRIWYGN